jgi:predicted phosphodiesterase
MKIGIISDIHSNLEALTVVLDAYEREGITEIICCGDVVGYGPNPNECIRLLDQRGVAGVRGNHDAAVLREVDLSLLDPAGRKAIHWTRKELSPEGREYLQRLPVTDRIQTTPLTIELVHGSPADPLWGRVHRRRDAYLTFRVSDPEVQLLLFGHTHHPVVFALDPDRQDVQRLTIEGDQSLPLELQPGRRHSLNPGSVGQPRDGNWRAGLCILELGDSFSARFQRLEYDVEKTRQKILRAGLPDELGNRLLSGV